MVERRVFYLLKREIVMSQAGSISKFLRSMAWLTLAAGCYGAGYLHGGAGYDGAAQSQRPAVHGPGDAAAPGTVQGTALVVDSQAAGADLDALLAEGDWFAVERWVQSNSGRLTTQHGQALRRSISQRMNKYDALVMRRILRSYLQVHAADVPVLFLLSDLQQMSGMPDAALDTLFDISMLPVDAQTMAAVMTDLRQILRVMDTQLRTAGAHADREALWRSASQRLPVSDYFRFEWAAALAAGGAHDQALRVLDETGTSDVQQQDIDHLRERIEQDAQGVSFQRDGDRLLASARTINGMQLSLLVDTGATVTTLTRDVLRTTGARRLRDTARIRTANGIVEAAVYEVPLLDVQGHRFENIRVLELPGDLPGLDGLLGLDLVDQMTQTLF